MGILKYTPDMVLCLGIKFSRLHTSCVVYRRGAEAEIEFFAEPGRMIAVNRRISRLEDQFKVSPPTEKERRAIEELTGRLEAARRRVAALNGERPARPTTDDLGGGTIAERLIRAREWARRHYERNNETSPSA